MHAQMRAVPHSDCCVLTGSGGYKCPNIVGDGLMQDSEATGPTWPKPAVAWFSVAVLVIAFIFSIADRIIIALLVDPI